MTDRITIELKGEAELQAKLDQIARGLTDLQPMLSEIGATLESNINRRFDTKTDPSGHAWAPISALTPQFHAITAGGKHAPGKDGWKALRKGEVTPAAMPGSLLERTRKMRDSLTSNTGADFVEVGMLRLTDKGRWNVAALHEFGTRKMPRRGLLTADPEAGTLGAEDRRDVYEIVQRYLDRL